MAATAATRSLRSTAPGASNGTSDFAMRALARVMRCGIAHQKGARDLRDAESRDDTKRERDLLRVGQVRMAADEQKPEHVVAIGGFVQARRYVAFVVLEIGDCFIGGQWRLAGFPARAIERR